MRASRCSSSSARSPRPTRPTWSRQLGAPRYAEREAASAALERLGRRALPALRAAREQRDPEVRTRAAALLAQDRGGPADPAEPWSRLDFQDAPLAEVVRSFSEQAGIKLALLPENAPDLAGRRVTLHEPAPLPFWKAIDRLCDAAHLQYNFGMHAFPNGREPAFPLFDGGVRPAAPVSDTGPFRVSVVGLHYQRDVDLPARPPQFAREPARGRARPRPGRRPWSTSSSTPRSRWPPSPGSRLSQNGPLRIIEAVDDRGNRSSSRRRGGPDRPARSGYFGFATGSVIQLQAPLTRPRAARHDDQAARGSSRSWSRPASPTRWSSRSPGAAGRTFQNDDVALTVHEVRAQPNNRPADASSSRSGPAPAAASASPRGLGGNDGDRRPPRRRTSSRSKSSTPRAARSPGISRASTPRPAG